MTGVNVVKAAAASGTRIRGVHLTFPAPTLIEVLADHVDFVYLDGEHGSFEWRDIEIACITAERRGRTLIARVPDQSAATIVHFLDRGVEGIVAPHVETIAQAQAIVAACYFGPLGDRSFGGARPGYLSAPDKPAYMRERNEATSLCLMIESGAGIEAAGALAAVEGVDYLSFGMMDLAQSLGHPGNPAHPAVQQAVAGARTRIASAGKRVREEFMTFAWVNELVLAGAAKLLS